MLGPQANPQFTKELNALQENFPGQVLSGLFGSSQKRRLLARVRCIPLQSMLPSPARTEALFTCWRFLSSDSARQGTTSFFIDKDATHNHWGSSMMSDAPDAVKSGDVKVTVPMINVVQLCPAAIVSEISCAM